MPAHISFWNFRPFLHREGRIWRNAHIRLGTASSAIPRSWPPRPSGSSDFLGFIDRVLPATWQSTTYYSVMAAPDHVRQSWYGHERFKDPFAHRSSMIKQRGRGLACGGERGSAGFALLGRVVALPPRINLPPPSPPSSTLAYRGGDAFLIIVVVPTDIYLSPWRPKVS